MPELPEVETTRRGIAPFCTNQVINKVIVRDYRLRWPIARTLPRRLAGEQIRQVHRRAKYLLFETTHGTLILHLGMSGSLRVTNLGEPAGKHDHVDLLLSNNRLLRFNDPRRFGSLHWSQSAPDKHRLLKHLGPEPLGDEFAAQYLYTRSRQHKTAIKNLIMNSKIVVGVGNIYASEALYLAGIHPARAASAISLARYEKLVAAIRQVLLAAIDAGGSTLNDFTQPDGNPGYFQHHFRVYGKTGQPCEQCGHPLSQLTIGQRSTFYCKKCQH